MHLPDSKIAAYPEYIQESTGGGSYDAFPAINDAVGQQMPNAPLRLGQVVFDKFGNGYMYCKFTGNAVQGDCLKMSANVTGAVVAADATSDNIHQILTDHTGITKNAEEGNWLVFEAAGLATVRRRIKGNTATASSQTRYDISKKDNRFGRGGYDADALAAAVSAAAKVAVVRRFHVQVAGAGDRCVGVARHSVTSGQMSLIGIHGAFLVKVVGTTDNIAENTMVTTAASGAAKGATTAAMTALDAWGAVGVFKGPATVSGAAALGYVFVQCLDRW